jgi:hypothetical protein
MPGLMQPLTCVEAPDVVDRIITKAREERMEGTDSPFVTLTHIVQLQKVEIDPLTGEPSPGEPFDSYADMKIKYDYVMAIRDLHDQEEP